MYSTTNGGIHQQVGNIFAQTIRVLGLIRTETFFVSSLHSLLILYCTLIRTKLGYATVAWNSVTSTDACSLRACSRSLYPFVISVSVGT
jgi:hypothetical protein